MSRIRHHFTEHIMIELDTSTGEPFDRMLRAESETVVDVIDRV